MSGLRHFQRRIATLVALFVLSGAGVADLAVAAQGPQVDFPLCSASQPEAPGHDRIDRADHCDFCLPGGHGGLAPPVPSPVRIGPPELALCVLAAESEDASRRAELAPLMGRAPPRHS